MNLTGTGTIKTPRILLNSIPKSGTHLMIQILQGIPNIKMNGEFYEGLPSQLNDHYVRLSRMQLNQFAWGHVYYSPAYAKILNQLEFKQIFLSRDPRDMVVSFVYFIIDKYPQHELYPYFTKQLKTNKQRYLALIEGVDHLKYPNIADWIGKFSGWLYVSNRFPVRFEDLIISIESRRQTLTKMVNYIWEGQPLPMSTERLVKLMENNIDPKKSRTFRSGKIGSWRYEFDQEVKAAFKKVFGSKLIQLGYEEDLNW